MSVTKLDLAIACKLPIWIRKHVPSNGGYGQCKELSEKFMKDFAWIPGLRLVRGHYHCPIWGRREHWWVEADGGRRFDVTQSQFPSWPILEGEYEEWDESQPEPVGMCMNCGEYVYEPRLNFCSDRCEAIVRTDMGI